MVMSINQADVGNYTVTHESGAVTTIYSTGPEQAIAKFREIRGKPDGWCKAHIETHAEGLHRIAHQPFTGYARHSND